MRKKNEDDPKGEQAEGGGCESRCEGVKEGSRNIQPAVEMASSGPRIRTDLLIV
jgi:hypothetical protein